MLRFITINYQGAIREALHIETQLVVWAGCTGVRVRGGVDQNGCRERLLAHAYRMAVAAAGLKLVDADALVCTAAGSAAHALGIASAPPAYAAAAFVSKAERTRSLAELW